MLPFVYSAAQDGQNTESSAANGEQTYGVDFLTDYYKNYEQEQQMMHQRQHERLRERLVIMCGNFYRFLNRVCSSSFDVFELKADSFHFYISVT